MKKNRALRKPPPRGSSPYANGDGPLPPELAERFTGIKTWKELRERRSPDANVNNADWPKRTFDILTTDVTPERLREEIASMGLTPEQFRRTNAAQMVEDPWIRQMIADL